MFRRSFKSGDNFKEHTKLQIWDVKSKYNVSKFLLFLFHSIVAFLSAATLTL